MTKSLLQGVDTLLSERRFFYALLCQLDSIVLYWATMLMLDLNEIED